MFRRKRAPRPPRHEPPEPPRPRRRHSLLLWILAAIGLVTVLVLLGRYAVVPLLVLLNGGAA